VRGLARFERRSAFRTWLCSIVARTALELMRARDRSWGDAPADELGGTAPPDGATRVDLERMMAEMPAGYRTVLVLHDVEGYRHAEIAEMTGISVGTSKSQLARARAWVRRTMGDDYPRRA